MVARGTSRQSRARALLVGLSLMVVAGAGCSATNADHSSSLAPHDSATVDQGPVYPTGRPLQPGPDVKPPGMVAPPPGKGTARYFNQSLRWQECAIYRCATVLAPLDYRRPNGQAVTLSLRMRPASARKLGTLFLNPGGPGGSGVEFLDDFAGLLGLTDNNAALSRYDIVGWDPRGVRASTPVRCFGDTERERLANLDESPDDSGERQALIDGFRNFGRSCLELSGTLLEHVSTDDTVRDLDLLRELLGDNKLNFYGWSYGTEVGSRYADAYPQRVGRIVLDGAVHLDGYLVSQVAGLDRSLGVFAAWCAGSACGVGASSVEVREAIETLLERLEASPLRAGERQLTQSLAAHGIFGQLWKDRSEWPMLASALQAAIDGQFAQPLLQLADDAIGRDADGHFSSQLGSSLAVACTDNAVDGVAEQLRVWEQLTRQWPVTGQYKGLDLGCSMWPVAARPAQRHVTARGAPPILVVGTTGDPNTPYDQAVQMAQRLESGVLLTVEGDGHGAYIWSNCARTKINAFLADGTAPDEPSRCPRPPA